MHAESQIREPLILGNPTYRKITDDIIAPIEGKANRLWYILFTISVLGFMWGIGCLSYTIGIIHLDVLGVYIFDNTSLVKGYLIPFCCIL